MIYGQRIRQAREFKGLTQTKLAELVGVKQEAISEMEKGEFMPSERVLWAIASNTGFLPIFFESYPEHQLPLGTLNYRARRSVSVRDETKAYQYANILYEQIHHIAQSVVIPPNRLPNLPDAPIKKAAQITRDAFGLSQNEPIKKLIRSLEDNGLFILTLPRQIPGIDAFSTWAQIDELRPVIVMISGAPMDRQRFSVGHELGHLVKHRTIKTSLSMIENEAQDFASEFLMPEQAMRDEMIPPLTLSDMAKLKLRWGVSMQALIMRAKNLGLIPEKQARLLFAEISANGWRTKEPVNLNARLELPRLARQMIETSYRTRDDYAIDSGLALDTATEFYAYV